MGKERRDWTLHEWQSIIWSDESKFNLFGNDGRVSVLRRIEEDLLLECIQQTVKFGGESVMV